MKKILVGVFLIGCSFQALAQESRCEEVLNQATEEFNAGHFYEIPDKLKSCIDNNDFTREQRVRAYLLLTQVYLIVDDPAGAEDSYLKLLRADPEYIATREKDPIDVVYLSKKFTSTPVFTPHLRIGLNTSFLHQLPSSPKDFEGQFKSGLRVGFQFGGGFDYNINNNWSLCVEGILATRGFKQTISGINKPNDPGDKTVGDVLTTIEKTTFLDVPLYLKYSDDKGRIRPFAYLGASGSILLSAKLENVFTNTTTTVTTDKVLLTSVIASGPDASIGFLRKTFSKSLILGGGMKYKIGKDFVFFDVRMMIGLNNMTTGNILAPELQDRPGYTKEIGELVTKYGYVSPYYSLNNVSLSVGYIRPIYNPRKIKRTNMKSILRVFDRKQ